MRSRLVFTLLVMAALVILACVPGSQNIMTWAKYGTTQVQWPHVMDLKTAKGRLFYFGARHSYDPSDEQFAAIEDAWLRLRPGIAFTEGGFPPIEASRTEAIEKAGEAGFVRFLAARDNVPTTTLDPSRAEEVAHLARWFSRERVKLFLLSRSAMQFVKRTGGAGLEQEVERILSIYSRSPGLSGSPRSAEELQEMYAAQFPEHGDYSEVPSRWFDPAHEETIFNEISRASSDYRDRYMVELLVRHVQDGQSVFAVVGGSHVVMQEPAIRSRLRSR